MSFELSIVNQKQDDCHFIGVLGQVFIVDLVKNNVELSHIMHTSVSTTVSELKKLLERKLQYSAATLCIALEK